jgi:hypothetical protein
MSRASFYDARFTLGSASPFRPFYYAAREITPIFLRKKSPDLFVKYTPHKIQRLTDYLIDFPIPLSVRQSPVLFIHIPKNAGTTISTLLYGAHCGHRSARFYLDADADFFRGRPSFAVVRNPWSRIVSAYEFGRTLSPHHRPFLRDTRQIFLKYKNFSDFINEYLWPNRGRINGLDPIFRSQTHYICDGLQNVLVNRVFRFEQIADLAQYLKGFGLKLDLSVRINASSTNSLDYHSFFRDKPQLIERVGEIYGQDAAIFNYGY